MTDNHSSLTERERSTQFVEFLTGHQRKLYGYIATMLPGDAAVADVLQETNLDLWNRSSEYDFDRPFLPWAFAFARLKVLAYRRSHSRSRLVFGDEAIDLIHDKCSRYAADADVRLVALQQCLKKLKPQQAELIRERYVEKTSVTEMAARFADTVHNISSRLHRIRKQLAECVNRNLQAEER